MADSEMPSHPEHSLANVDIGSRLLGGRRGSNLSTFGITSPSDAANKHEQLESIQVAVVQLFQKKKLKENELGSLQETVRYLSETEMGSLIYDYYKDQLLKKGMVILRENIKNERGADLLQMLGETWNYFFKEILPVLQSMLYPLPTHDVSIRDVTLLGFRNIVLLKVSIEDAIEHNRNETPPPIKQMLLVLQGVPDLFPGENYFKLEKMIARVVVPYLGLRGLYLGHPEPSIKAKSRMTPKVIITADSTEEDKNDFNSFPSSVQTWSPSAAKRLSGRLATALAGNKKLAPVVENVLTCEAGHRRHSIIS
ncbi:proline-rich protein 5-like isoform X2 [Gigantopelta aegis]|uniref:proline-rich protein 5-like isoform X2 n=1 Tax=Gigantopelta aegis TaxID=1735272 RepID=UPI001B88B6EC|nr:proline-rich protein 5-like isoform X2 [Gigantopelta aegis]